VSHAFHTKIVEPARIEIATGHRPVAIKVDALGEPQAHEKHLVAFVLLGEQVVDDEPGARGFDLFEPRFRQWLVAGRVPAFAANQPTMGARSDTGVFAVTPIDQVMPAFRARLGVVGNLVRRHAGGIAYLLRHLIKLSSGIRVGNRELAGAMQRLKWRIGLDGELVEREVVGGPVDCRLRIVDWVSVGRLSPATASRRWSAWTASASDRRIQT